MEKKKFNIVEYSHLSVIYGFIFEIDDRQFGLSHTDTVVNVHDLYSGGRVLWFQFNDLLQQTDELLIEFAKFYISNIDKKQFDSAIEKVKNDYPYIEFPVNSKFIDFEIIKTMPQFETEVQAISIKKGDSFKLYGKGKNQNGKKVYKVKDIYKGDFLREPGNVLFITDECRQIEMKLTDFVLLQPNS